MIKIDKVKVTNTQNDYLSDWDVQLNNDGKKSTKLDIKMPTKKEFSPEMQVFSFNIVNKNSNHSYKKYNSYLNFR